MRLLVINGPNLSLLGTREPDVYGSTTLTQLEQKIRDWGDSLGLEIDLIQSNAESDLIDAVHGSEHDGIVINPGALTHTSRALADALSSVDVPAIEVHISNIMERESWRRNSVLAGVAIKSIYGRGLVGYRDALRHHVNRVVFEYQTVAYGPHPDNVGDLRRAGPSLVVLVHGGFWRSEWTRDTMESIAVDLTRRGFSTWNVEYRRLDAGGGWPASAHDVMTALEFTPRLGFEEKPSTVIGHSAGGYLALWAGDRIDPQPRVIALAPITDLVAHASSGLFGATEAGRLLEFGAPDRLEPKGPKATLVHGTEDRLVPPSQSERLGGSADAEIRLVDGGHFDLLDPKRGHWPQVVDAVSSWTVN